MAEKEDRLTERENNILIRTSNMMMKKAAEYYKSYIYDIAEVAYALDIETKHVEKAIQELLKVQNEELTQGKDAIFNAVDNGINPDSVKMNLKSTIYEGDTDV